MTVLSPDLGLDLMEKLPQALENLVRNPKEATQTGGLPAVGPKPPALPWLWVQQPWAWQCGPTWQKGNYLFEVKLHANHWDLALTPPPES